MRRQWINGQRQTGRQAVRLIDRQTYFDELICFLSKWSSVSNTLLWQTIVFVYSADINNKTAHLNDDDDVVDSYILWSNVYLAWKSNNRKFKWYSPNEWTEQTNDRMNEWIEWWTHHKFMLFKKWWIVFFFKANSISFLLWYVFIYGHKWNGHRKDTNKIE